MFGTTDLRLVARDHDDLEVAPDDAAKIYYGKRLVAFLSSHSTGNILTPVAAELEPLRGAAHRCREDVIVAVGAALAA